MVEVPTLRNLAIIAHVDHGKTTLIDRILGQCHGDVGTERVMDSMSLEQERGITIMSKVTSVEHGGVRLNIVDTPGHADFGGEVERVMNMVDGVALLVCATEGPNTQTKYVTMKALQRGLRPVVVINKVDRDTSRVDEVVNEVFDLFVSLDANDEQLDFPILYASARDGWAVNDLEADERRDMTPLLDQLSASVPPPRVEEGAPFAFLASMLSYDNFLGRVLTGRIAAGTARVNMPVHALNLEGKVVETGRITKIMARRGTETVALEEAGAGDIVQLAGLSDASVTHTVASPEVVAPLFSPPLDPPTLSMVFGVNSSPFQGQDGTRLTSAMIGERLERETQNNVSISVTTLGESYEVKGRGELQLSVLIESMRREGFELSVSPPRVLYLEEEGRRMEPVEEVHLDVDDEHVGAVMEKLASRKGELVEMVSDDRGRTRLRFRVPSRCLLGYRSAFNMDTRGRGVMNRVFDCYETHKGQVDNMRNRGVLVSTGTGTATAYALASLEPRGVLFIGPQAKVYEGMIVGENAKEGDLPVNPTRTKQLTNIRAAGSDEAIRLSPPRIMSLEECIGYMAPDELLEVTPMQLRLRKAILDPTERKKRAAEFK